MLVITLGGEIERFKTNKQKPHLCIFHVFCKWVCIIFCQTCISIQSQNWGQRDNFAEGLLLLLWAVHHMKTCLAAAGSDGQLVGMCGVHRVWGLEWRGEIQWRDLTVWLPELSQSVVKSSALSLGIKWK